MSWYLERVVLCVPEAVVDGPDAGSRQVDVSYK